MLYKDEHAFEIAVMPEPQILFLYSQLREGDELFDMAAKRQSVKLCRSKLSSLILDCTKGKINLKVDNKAIDDFDLVYFRNILSDLEAAKVIIQHCLNCNISIADPALHFTRPYIDRKSFEHIVLAQAGLPVVDTLFLSKAAFIKSNLEFPCILKISDGSQGIGVHLVENKEEGIRVFEQHQKNLLCQKYIKNTGDFRYLVVGDRVVGAMKRESNDPTEFRNNVSLGGKVSSYQASDEEKKLAVQAAQVMGFDIAGVDIIKDGELAYILEVNRGPQLMGFCEASGIDIHDEIVSFLFDRYLSKPK